MSDVLELDVNDKKWKLARVGLSLRLDAEEKIREARREEFRLALEQVKALPEDRTMAALLSCIDNVMRNVCVSNSEAQGWLNSPTGELHILHRSLKKHQPDVSLGAVRQFLDDISTEQYAQIDGFLISKVL